MRKQGLFFLATCAIIGALSGCPTSSTIAVQEDQRTASVYADQGGVLRWEDTDTNPAGFQVIFQYGYNPCREASPIKTRPNETEVVCHVVQPSGTYAYQVLPLDARTPAGSGATSAAGGVNNLAQVGDCKNCRGGKTGQQKQAVAMTPDHLDLIGCDNNTKGADVPSPPPFIIEQTMAWKYLGPTAPASYSATFNNKNPDGSPVTIPPCKEGFGPFYGPNFCTLADAAAGQTYSYTVQRSDCGNGTPSDPPTTITVKAKE